MAKDFGAAERRIGKIFAQGKVFTLNENTYEILFSGKPGAVIFVIISTYFS